MNKVYLVVAIGSQGKLATIKTVVIACKSKSDAEALLDIWGEDYTIIEVPYLAVEAPVEVPIWFPYDGNPKSIDVEPMPFIGKPPTVQCSVI